MTEGRWGRRGRSLRTALAAGVSAVAVMSALAASPPAQADTVISAPSLGPQSWSGGNFTVTGGGLIAGGNTGVNASGTALGTLTNSGTIGGQNFGLTNGGTIGAIIDNAVLFGGNGLSNTAFIGTLTNSGTIAGPQSAIFNNDGTITTLTNASGGTISGSTDAIRNSGSIGAIVNSGTIGGGTVAVTVTSLFGSSVSIFSSGPTAITNTGSGSIGVITNSGIIRGNIASPNQALAIAGGTGTVGTLTGYGGAGSIGTISSSGVSFTGGTLLLNDNVTVGAGHTVTNGATLQVTAPVTISGNYVQSGSGALVIGVASASAYGDLVVTGSATLTGVTVSVSGQLAAGTITLVSASGGLVGDPSKLSVNGSTETLTIVNNTLELVPAAPYWPVTSATTTAGTLTTGTLVGSIGSGGTISVSGVGVTVIGSGTTLVNNGTINAGLTGVNVGASYSLASLTNSGTIGAITGVLNNGTIGTLGNNSGVITAGGINGYTGINNSGAIGTLTNSGTITSSHIGLENNSVSSSIGTLGNSGTISGGLFGLTNAGSIGTLANNNGTITGGYTGISNSGSIGALINSGIISGGGGTKNAIFNTGSGSIGTITNSGVIAGNIKSSSQDLTIAGGTGTVGTLTGASGAVGTITSSGVTFSNGTLLLGDHVTVGSGSGTVTNNATLQVNGTISISGNYVQSGGALVIGVASASSYGELVVGGTANLAGATIFVSALSSGALPLGSYTLVSAGTLLGSVGGMTLSGSSEVLTIVGNALELVPAYWPVTLSTATPGTLSSGLGSISSNGTISGIPVGVTVTGSGTTLTNNGTILASQTAVNVGTLVNMASLANSGSISGSVSGINNSGTIGALNNGRVITARSAGLNNDGGIGTLTNSGSISGIQAIYNIGSIGTLTNNGSISSGQWAIFNVGSIGVITNNGVIAGTIASPGQDLTIAGGTGTVGTLTGSAGASGTITSSGVSFSNGTLLLNDHVSVGSGTVTNGATLQVNARVTISGNYVQSASGALVIGVASASTYGDLVVTGGATLTGVTVSVSSQLAAGTITLVSANTGLVANTNSMTLAQPNGSNDTLTIVGKALELVVPSAPYWPVTGPVTMTGTLSNAAGSISSGTINGGGTISGVATGVTVIGSGTTLTNLGVINAGLTGVAVGTLVNMASLTNSGSIGASVGIVSLGTIGALTNTIGGSIGGSVAGIENFGSISTLTNSGTINGSTIAIGNFVGGSIGAIANSGTISSSSFAIINGSSIGAITNSGTIAGNISSSSQALTIAGGTGTVGTLTGYGGAGSIGTITSSGVTFASGTLQLNDHVSVGSGTVTNKANLLVNNTITVAGNYVQNSAGTLVIGVSPNSSFGELVVAGSASLAGTVSITGSIGTGTIALISANTLVGGNSVTLASLPGGSKDVLTVVNNTLELVPPTPYWPVTITTTTAGTLSSGTLGSIGGTGTITNVPVGVTVVDSGTTLTNTGKISASDTGVVLGGFAGLASLTNSGSISGGNFAIFTSFEGGSIGVITNSGVISSGNRAIETAYYGVGAITNSGTISGGITAIVNAANTTELRDGGRIGVITNSGTISGGIAAIKNGADAPISAITNSGRISGGSYAIINDQGNIGAITNSGIIGIIGSSKPIAAIDNSGSIGAITNTGTFGGAISTISGNQIGIRNIGSPYAGGSGYIGTISNNLGTIVGGQYGINNLLGEISAINNTLAAIIGGTIGILNVGVIDTISNFFGLITGIDNEGTIASLFNNGTLTAAPQGTITFNAGHLRGATAAELAGASASSIGGGGSGTAILNTGSLGAITNSGVIAGNIVSASQDLTIAGGASGSLGTLTGATAGAIGSIISSGITFTGGNLLLNDHVTVGSGKGTVSNNANLQVNAPISISGNYSQSGSGALVIGVASPTSYGQLVVSGNASLTGHNISIVPLNGTSLTPGESLTLISAASLTEDGQKASGGLTATVSSNHLVTLTGTDWTVITGNGASTPISWTQIGQAAGGHAQPVGAVLDQLAGAAAYQPLLGSLSALGQPQQTHALKQLGVGQVTPQLNDGAMLATPMVTAVERHLWAVGSSDAAGAAAGSEARQGAWWGEVLGGAVNRGSSAGADGYDGTAYGLLFGVDVPLAKDVTGGLAVNWLRHSASGKSDSSAESTTLDSYQVNGYGLWRPDGGRAFAQGLLSAGFNQYDQNRGIDFLGARATAKFNGAQYLARLGGGYDIALGDLTVTPLAALQAWRLENRAYTENGAGLADLAVGRAGLNGVESELGGRLSHRFQLELGPIETDLQASWVHSYVNGPIALSASMGGAGFVDTTSRVDPDGARVVAGATLLRSAALSFTIEYDGEFHHGFMDNTGRLVFRSQF